jgi:hypothetical protein
MALNPHQSAVTQPRVFFSAEISEISPETGFTGHHRYFPISNEISRKSQRMLKI